MNSSQAKKTNVKSNRKGFSVVRNTYFRPNGSVNKVAMVVSIVVVIALVIAGVFMYSGTVKKSTFDSDVVETLSTGDAQEAVATAFLKGIEEYNGGDSDYESQRQAILKMLAEQLESDTGFTSDQKAAMEDAIEQYLNSVEIYGTVDENADTISTITEMVNSTAAKNSKDIKQLKEMLNTLIKSNSGISSEKIKELQALVDEINNYIDGQGVTYDELLTKIQETIAKNDMTIHSLLENSMGASTWSSTTTYSKGDFVLYDNQLYISLRDGNKATLGDTSSWNRTSMENIVKSINSSQDELKESLVTLINTKNDSTTQALNETKTEITNTIINLDTKYSVYYEHEFSTDIDLSTGAASVTINSASIKPTSAINIIYNAGSTTGYTAEYTQEEGSLVITLTANSKQAPSTLAGTIYIDNSMDNAQSE